MNDWMAILGVVLLVLALVWWLLGRKGGASQSVAGAVVTPEAVKAADGYSPSNVGNDASARPWEQQPGGFDAKTEPVMVDVPAAPPAAASDSAAPAGFDAVAFLEASKVHFVQLQAAWDRSDVPALRAMMTEEMVSQIQAQLAERERQAGAAAGQSEVVRLDAKLLGVEEQPDGYLASVEFSGLIRDEPAAEPNPFREVWSITRPKGGSEGWRVAGVQALQ
ncbi:Tim44 domain-containing protein [Malikia sp.]|uniref:Tim44 domain-containing protein n=1 Tax=Malikia sp. TaxID=2070706 RepID=UPI002636D355|nr:Tim44-like domain-containing protein [Malikia sp.]MDD2730366.1 Tim44-like domain-containing protein [Malikia sp.]